MSNRARNITVVVIVAVALVALVLLVSSVNGRAGKAQDSAKDAAAATRDIAAALAKRSPITQFDAAVALHNDCRKDIEDHYLGAIGDAISPDATDEEKLDAARRAAELASGLDSIEAVCPAPLPAVISPDGKVLQPPVIPEQYTCKIDRTPCPPPG